MADTWIIPGKKTFYNVYENGTLEEIQEFSISVVESYHLNNIENITENNTNSKSKNASSKTVIISEYSQNIIEFVKERGKNCSANKLYVTGERYFFDVFDGAKGKDIIFEYSPNEDKVKKIVGFEGKTIEHIELYERK